MRREGENQGEREEHTQDWKPGSHQPDMETAGKQDTQKERQKAQRSNTDEEKQVKL